MCIILGLPGVGKTHLKYLLLDKPPPRLRSSTTCAESPMRIEIRTISGTRVHNRKGKWKEIDNEDMLDTVAKMIIFAESALSQKSDQSLLSKIARLFQPRSHMTSDNGAKLPALNSLPEISVPTISDTCHRAMKGIMNKLVQRISKLKSKLCSDEAPAESSSEPAFGSSSKWVYFTDSGGQPQYHELLPLFVHQISSALCVVRLTDNFDEVQLVEYYDHGKRVGAIQQTQLSVKDTIQSLVNTIQSYCAQDRPPPKIIMVGTHLDQLEEKSLQHSAPKQKSRSSHYAAAEVINQAPCDMETLKEKDKQLLEMLKPEFSDQLMYYTRDMKKLLFPLNTLNPGEREKVIAQSIRDAVEASGAKNVKIPIWWYIMELLLQELARELGRGVLSRTECLEMASLLNINERSFDAALNFFDELNIVKYSPDVLPNVVFVDSQIPLDKVSELVHHSYLLRQPEEAEPSIPVDGKWEHFRHQGVVSIECLGKFNQHYVSGIFSEKDLSKLFKKLLVFAPIPPPKWVKTNAKSTTDEETHYVMPSLLLTLSDAELEKHRVSSQVAATLLVRFPHGSRRAGVFCCFVVHLIKYCGWDLLLEAKEPLHRNCIRLQLLTSPPCVITLIDSNSYIEVHMNITEEVSRNEYINLFPMVKHSILNGICAACSALNYKKTKPELTFYCPHIHQPKELKNKQHTVTLTPDRKYWRCDIIPQLSGPLSEHHLIWFGLPRGKLL